MNTENLKTVTEAQIASLTGGEDRARLLGLALTADRIGAVRDNLDYIIQGRIDALQGNENYRELLSLAQSLTQSNETNGLQIGQIVKDVRQVTESGLSLLKFGETYASENYPILVDYLKAAMPASMFLTTPNKSTLHFIDVSIDPTNTDTVYALVTGGVVKSTDCGVTFSAPLQGSPNGKEICAYGDKIIVTYEGYSSSSKYWYSEDGGASWTEKNLYTYPNAERNKTGILLTYHKGAFYLHQVDCHYVAGPGYTVTSRLVKIDPYNWSHSGTVINGISDIACNNNRIAYATNSNTIRYSDDNGETWNDITTVVNAQRLTIYGNNHICCMSSTGDIDRQGILVQSIGGSGRYLHGMSTITIVKDNGEVWQEDELDGFENIKNLPCTITQTDQQGGYMCAIGDNKLYSNVEDITTTFTLPELKLGTETQYSGMSYKLVGDRQEQ